MLAVVGNLIPLGCFLRLYPLFQETLEGSDLFLLLLRAILRYCSPVTPIQAIDLTNWISRSYGLDPVAGGAFGNVWKCTYNDGFRCTAVRTDVNRQGHLLTSWFRLL